MLATINPEMPIWDSVVLKNLGLKFKGRSTIEKLSQSVDLYDTICKWYRVFLDTDEAKNMIEMFDYAFPEFEQITKIKKIDFMIWAVR